jgi:hypothetical protein
MAKESVTTAKNQGGHFNKGRGKLSNVVTVRLGKKSSKSSKHAKPKQSDPQVRQSGRIA